LKKTTLEDVVSMSIESIVELWTTLYAEENPKKEEGLAAAAQLQEAHEAKIETLGHPERAATMRAVLRHLAMDEGTLKIVRDAQDGAQTTLEAGLVSTIEALIAVDPARFMKKSASLAADQATFQQAAGRVELGLDLQKKACAFLDDCHDTIPSVSTLGPTSPLMTAAAPFLASAVAAHLYAAALASFVAALDPASGASAEGKALTSLLASPDFEACRAGKSSIGFDESDAIARVATASLDELTRLMPALQHDADEAAAMLGDRKEAFFQALLETVGDAPACASLRAVWETSTIGDASDTRLDQILARSTAPVASAKAKPSCPRRWLAKFFPR
jgi:hypothetical protein